MLTTHTPSAQPRGPTNRRAAGPRMAAALLLGSAALFGSVQLCMSARAVIASGVALDLRHPAALEHALEADFPARQDIIGAVNGLRYRLLGGASDQVRLGRGGWIFLKAELLARPDAAQNAALRAAAIIRLQAQLAARGTRLVVAVSPAKARIEAAFLADGRLPPGLPVNGYRDFQRALRAAHVDTVDLATALAAAPGARFYRTDTHWNTLGAEVAARAVAAFMRRLGLQGEQQFVTRVSGPLHERPGDLLHLMGLEHVPDFWRPAPDLERETQTTEVGVSSSELLGGATTSGGAVVLVGSSYCLRGNFQGALEQALGQTVINVAREGADFAGSLREYLNDPAFVSAPPRVLIWEFPERFLSVPPGEQDQLPDVSPKTHR